MPLNVISNFAANVAHRHLSMSDAAATNSVAKLSAGTRVLTAKDDAASLAIGSRLRAEVSALKQAQVNAGQAVSMLQIADGALSRINDILVRMKALAVQSSSGQLSDTERGMLNQEFTALRDEIDRIADDTEFNGTKLLNGSNSFSADVTGATAITPAAGFEQFMFTNDTGAFTATDTVQVGFDDTTGQFTVTNTVTGIAYVSDPGITAPGAGEFRDVVINGAGLTIQLNSQFDDAAAIVAGATSEFTVAGGTSTNLSLQFKVGTGTDTYDDVTINLAGGRTTALSSNLSTSVISSQADAELAIGEVGTAIDQLAENRALLGASQNRIEFASANIATTVENTEAARSALLDLDVASEMSAFTSKQILVQAGVSMLAQANQLPQNLLKLFQ